VGTGILVGGPPFRRGGFATPCWPAMEKMLPLGVYFVAQKYCTKEFLGDAIPESVVAWMPMILAIVALVVMNKISSAQAEKTTGALIGQEAPNFDMKPKGGGDATTLKDFIEKTKLPTVVDFYQNF